MSKIASIDIGSNTLLLLIVDTSTGEAIVDECDFGRLGQGLSSSKSLHPDAIARSLEITRRYRALMDEKQVETVRCVGTQALREGDNRDEFIAPAEQILGASIEIISGEREAELVATAVKHSLPELWRADLCVVDVGGASTEYIVKVGEELQVVSLPVGAVRLSEKHLRSDPPTPAEVAALHHDIDLHIASLSLPRGISVIGSAGTATSLASIRLGLTKYDPTLIHGYSCSRAEVKDIHEKLLGMSQAERLALPGLEPKRADVIAGGVAIYARSLELLQADQLTISDRGVRWGLIYEARERRETS